MFISFRINTLGPITTEGGTFRLFSRLERSKDKIFNQKINHFANKIHPK